MSVSDATTHCHCLRFTAGRLGAPDLLSCPLLGSRLRKNGERAGNGGGFSALFQL